MLQRLQQWQGELAVYLFGSKHIEMTVISIEMKMLHMVKCILILADDTRLHWVEDIQSMKLLIMHLTAFADLTGQGAGVVSAVQPAPVTRSFEGEEFTYKLGFDHNLNDDQLVYATFSTGFKPGGSNPTTNIAGVNTYDPEEVEVFEVGMKNTLWMERQLNVSAYQNDY